MEAIIPTKIGMPAIRTETLKEANIEVVVKDLDMVDELREAAAVRIASYQQRLASLHNRRVKPRTFKTSELVLRRVFENTANPADKKQEVPTQLGRTIHSGSSRDNQVFRTKQGKRDHCSQNVECHAPQELLSIVCSLRNLLSIKDYLLHISS